MCSELEEELVFEEFKRSYLKGMMGDNDEDDDDGNVSGGDDMAPKEKWTGVKMDVVSKVFSSQVCHQSQVAYHQKYMLQIFKYFI